MFLPDLIIWVDHEIDKQPKKVEAWRYNILDPRVSVDIKSLWR